MKTKFFQICACAFLLMAAKKAQSQDLASNGTKSNLVAYNTVSNKNDLDTNYSLKNVNSVMVNDKIAKSFAKDFTDNTQQNWTSVGRSFSNRFYNNGNLTNVLFSKRGRLIYTIEYVSEKNLPADVRKIIKSEYYDYTIISATRVEEDNRDIWVVKLDDALVVLTVRVENGEMEQVGEYQKIK